MVPFGTFRLNYGSFMLTTPCALVPIWIVDVAKGA
jgi:hypothetical protein